MFQKQLFSHFHRNVTKLSDDWSKHVYFHGRVMPPNLECFDLYFVYIWHEKWFCLLKRQWVSQNITFLVQLKGKVQRKCFNSILIHLLSFENCLSNCILIYLKVHRVLFGTVIWQNKHPVKIWIGQYNSGLDDSWVSDWKHNKVKEEQQWEKDKRKGDNLKKGSLWKNPVSVIFKSDSIMLRGTVVTCWLGTQQLCCYCIQFRPFFCYCWLFGKPFWHFHL